MAFVLSADTTATEIELEIARIRNDKIKPLGPCPERKAYEERVDFLIDVWSKMPRR